MPAGCSADRPPGADVSAATDHDVPAETPADTFPRKRAVRKAVRIVDNSAAVRPDVRPAGHAVVVAARRRPRGGGRGRRGLGRAATAGPAAPRRRAPAAVLELAAAGVTAVGVGVTWPAPTVVLVGWAGLLLVVLGAVDIAVHRLPDALDPARDPDHRRPGGGDGSGGAVRGRSVDRPGGGRGGHRVVRRSRGARTARHGPGDVKLVPDPGPGHRLPVGARRVWWLVLAFGIVPLSPSPAWSPGGCTRGRRSRSGRACWPAAGWWSPGPTPSWPDPQPEVESFQGPSTLAGRPVAGEAAGYDDVVTGGPLGDGRAHPRRVLGPAAAAPVGRLAFVNHDDPVILPVNHAVDGETIVFARPTAPSCWPVTPGCGRVRGGRPGSRAAHRMECAGPGHRADRAGRGNRDPAGPVGPAAVGRPGGTSHWVRITVQSVSGRETVHPG